MLNQEHILNRLKIAKGNSSQTFKSVNHSDFDMQRVAVCIHTNDVVNAYHRHNFYEINYVVKGNCINLVEEEPIVMREGEFILMHPCTHHTLYATDDCVVQNFLINENWFIDLLTIYNFEDTPMSEFIRYCQTEKFYKYLHIYSCNFEIKNLAGNIINLNNSVDTIKYPLMEAEMIKLLCLLFSNNVKTRLSESKGQNTDVVRKLINHMTNNYDVVTLDSLSEYAGYSKTHICRLFKVDVGKSFTEILADIRLTYAKSLLINTNESIRSIGYKIGYDCVEYFQRLFKKKFGITPGKYRETHKIK